MCIAWPMRLLEILPDHYGVAELDGVRRRVGLRLLSEVKVGDYVLVHAGYAIEKIDSAEAVTQLEILAELKAGVVKRA
ncbi:hypothetical protein SDC9_193170 [bioreactor metagenome]|uniref:Hydrogenase maturation factor HybG n=1 Tax=bioreactor metagenome TaxID=1076179 RepID=A0A645IDW2_9ZZZZ